MTDLHNTPAYIVSAEHLPERLLAAVSTELDIASVPARFAEFLNQVYSTARAEGIALDGLNVFVYRDSGPDRAAIDFGVGVNAPFEARGAMKCTVTPAGLVAHTTHRGEYRGLRNAHAAVKKWCADNGHALAGPRWEAYGHWTEDASNLETEVCYLLRS